MVFKEKRAAACFLFSQEMVVVKRILDPVIYEKYVNSDHKNLCLLFQKNSVEQQIILFLWPWVYFVILFFKTFTPINISVHKWF